MLRRLSGHDHHANGTACSTEHDLAIFGGAAEISSFHMFISFCAVAVCLPLLGQLLNALEQATEGTAYHLMLQRMYREVMMVGCTAFFWTVAAHAELPISAALFHAFQYAEVTCFLIACFFCAQAGFIMCGSLRQALAWDRAAKISSEELQMDVEASLRRWPRWWRNLFTPFVDTRDQIEFRIFQSIFSSAYNISTHNNQFDFGVFLKQTHEANLLELIDISPAKWAIILIVVAIASYHDTLWGQISTCQDESPGCVAREQVVLFTCLGVLVFLLCCVAAYCGRRSELKLIRLSGVHSADDYLIFLMVEAKLHDRIARSIVDKDCVKSTITELQTEAEREILEAELGSYSKRRSQRSQKSAKASIPLLDITSHVLRAISIFSRGSLGTAKVSSRDSSQKTPKASPVGIDKAQEAAPPRVAFTLPDAVREFDEVSSRSASTSRRHAASISHRVDIVPKRRYGKSVTIAGDGFLVEEGLLLHKPQAPEASPDLLRSAAKSVRGLITQFSMRGGGLNLSPSMAYSEESSHRERMKQKFTMKMRKNFQQGVGKQNFIDVFPLTSPGLYYFLIDFLMTCNSLYLAWYFTNFMYIAQNTGSASVFYTLMAILPPLITTPILTLVIKTSSVLQAVTKLNMDIVSTVVDMTENNMAVVEAFRVKFIQRLEEETGKNNEEGVVELFSTFHIDEDGITRSMFRDILAEMQMHYVWCKYKLIYSAINSNNDGSLSMEELVRFLFPERTLELDKKRRKFFDVRYTKVIRSMGKVDVAKRILKFLDPDSALGGTLDFNPMDV